MPRLAALAVLALTLGFGALPFVPGKAADECRVWQIGMSEEEEGRTLVASICAGPEARDAQLAVRCFGQTLNLRYRPGDDADHNDAKRDFLFRAGKRRRPVFLAHEGLDGAFAAYLVEEHTVFEMLKAGRSLQITDPLGRVAPVRFTLNGARTAIDLLVKRCKR